MFGSPTAAKERPRDAAPFGWLASTLVDIRYATRALVASPGFVAAIIPAVRVSREDPMSALREE